MYAAAVTTPAVQDHRRPPTRASGDSNETGTGRARPLPPDERRAMLIAATLPLVAQHGTKVTTRQIAQAAGVAEGTIFRVFPDKEALIRAALAQCLDPAPTLAELRRVELGLPLEQRLVEVTTILQRHLIRVFDLLIAVRLPS